MSTGLSNYQFTMCLNNCLLNEDNKLSYDPLDTTIFEKFEDTCDYLEIKSTENIDIGPNDLAIMQLNSHGLISKQSELSKLLYDILGEHKIDVVILCETWLTKESEKRLHFPGYSY